mgnify:FL=1
MNRNLLLLASLALCACSSSLGVVYQDGDPTRLKNGTVTVKTA